MTERPFSGKLAASSEVDRYTEARVLGASRADAVGQTDSVGRNYGGGCATRRGIRRGMKPNQGWASCTQIGKPITSSAAIVASLRGDGGQGRVGVDSTGASR
jgi:hypothetical protein